MDVQLIQGRLTQAKQIFIYINFKLAKGDFDAAINMAEKLVPIFTQIGMADLIEEAHKLIGLLQQQDLAAATKFIAEFNGKIDAKLSEATPHLHLAREIKCPHCHANILRDSKFCSECGKSLS